MPKNTEPTCKPSASWASEPLVACTDGPHINQWFTRTDWDTRIEGARYMHEDRGQRRSPCLDYVPTGNTIPHPKEPLAQGAELVHRPGRKR